MLECKTHSRINT